MPMQTSQSAIGAMIGAPPGTQTSNPSGGDILQDEARRRFQAQQAAQQQGTQLQLGQMAAGAQMLPAQLAQERFNTVFPYLQQQYAGLSKPGTVGGASGQGPEISTGPVLNDQQIQQQVNSQTAANDQKTAGNVRAMQGSLGGRGLGANSPLAQALGGQMQSSNLATNTANQRDTRLGAAQGNATQLLNSQQAREQQFAARQAEDISRRAPIYSQQNALIAALAGLA